eukprot:COSAG01_NODE_13334_length_1599_cov_837.978667_1_plen_35_part_10
MPHEIDREGCFGRLDEARKDEVRRADVGIGFGSTP